MSNIRPALLIVDPIVSAVTGNSHKNTEVRRDLQPLVDFAEANNCAVLGITHYSKGTQGHDPLERVTGSLAFGAVARIVLSAARLPDDHASGASRVLVRTKSNLGVDGDGFYYDVVPENLDSGLIKTIRIEFGEAVEGLARDILAEAETVADEDERTNLDEAADWLVSVLIDDPKPRKEVIADATKCGFKKRTIERARKKAGIKFRYAEFGKGTEWYLPDNSRHRKRTHPLGEIGHSRQSHHQNSQHSDDGADGNDGADVVTSVFQEAPSTHPRHPRQAQSVKGNDPGKSDPPRISTPELSVIEMAIQKFNARMNGGRMRVDAFCDIVLREHGAINQETIFMTESMLMRDSSVGHEK